MQISHLILTNNISVNFDFVECFGFLIIERQIHVVLSQKMFTLITRLKRLHHTFTCHCIVQGEPEKSIPKRHTFHTSTPKI